MRRTFLAALLVAVFAAVLAPSATTKKTPPPAPSGTFTVSPGSVIGFTNMTLNSQDRVQVGVCVMTSDIKSDCNTYQTLGDNYTSTDPGSVVQLADWGYVNEYVFPVKVVVGVIDWDKGAAYLSDGTLSTMDGTWQQFSHVTLGWAKDALILSINDGSQNTFTDWQPALGAGSFNATVQTVPWLQSSSSDVKITNITGYSDGPALDATNNPVCSFHTEFTFTSPKAKTLQGAVAATAIWQQSFGEAIGSLEGATLGASPFDPGTFFTSTNPAADNNYVFVAMIQSSSKTGDLFVLQLSSTFTLDPTTYVDGCPPEGQLVSTNFSQ